MAKLDELVVELTAETSKLRAELKNAVGATEKASAEMQSAIKDFSDNSSKDVSFFETSMATMAGFLGSNVVTGAFNILKDAVRDLGQELVGGAKAAIANEQSLTKLANSLAITGQYTKKGMIDLQNYIDMQEKSTGISDDAVTSSLSLLSAMNKLSTDGLKKASQAAIDLSSAYGIDLNAATMLVGKGIEGNVTAFSRMGIVVREGSDRASNLDNILKALSGTSGAAAGAFKSFGGQLDATKIAFDDYFKTVAKSFTENAVLKAMISEVADVFREMTGSAEENAGTLKGVVAESLTSTVELAGTLVLMFDYLTKTVTFAYRAVQTAIFGMTETFTALYDFLSGGDPFAATKGSFEDLVNTFSEETILDDIAQKFAKISSAGRDAMTSLTTETNAATAATVAQGAVVKEVTAAEQARLDLIKQFATGLAEQGAAVDSSYQFQLALLQSNLELELTTQAEYFAAKTDLMLQQFDDEQALLEDAYAKKLITDQQYNDAKVALQNKQALATRASNKEQVDYEKLTAKQRADNLASTFQVLATLSTSGNKELAAIGKAAAITTATIDGFAAVQKALAAAPPPFNFALAALVGVATAANVAKIAGVGLKGGIDTVPGNGNQDNYPAVLAPGERVVPSQTNKDLKAFLADQKNGNSRNVTLNINISNNVPASREAGQQMIEAINDAIANGSLRINQAI